MAQTLKEALLKEVFDETIRYTTELIDAAIEGSPNHDQLVLIHADLDEMVEEFNSILEGGNSDGQDESGEAGSIQPPAPSEEQPKSL